MILPERNEPDLDDVPEAVREVMTFHLVDDVREVLELALEDAPVAQASQPDPTLLAPQLRHMHGVAAPKRGTTAITSRL